MKEKIRNKKSLFAVIIAVVVVLVGVTYALFFSSTSMENVFNVGNYNVITTEDIEAPDDWLPGEKIDKTIYAMNLGDIPVAFRVKYDERWEDAQGNDITSSIPDGTVTINFINRAHWEYNEDDGYYYHKYYIKPSESACSFISGITLNEDLMGSASCEMDGDSYNCTSDFDGLAGAHYIISFTKESVIYDKYQEFWNTDIEITEEPPLIQILNSERTKDNLQVGDEICINGTESTECFNFIEYDGNNIKLLSKWNLKVGKIYTSGGAQTGTYSSSDTGYGLQSSEAKGYVSGQTRYGTVAFSATNYWYDGSSLKSKYGSSYPADVYDTDYSDASGTNYSVAYYVEDYKDILETYGLTVQSARLLTYSEATDSSIGCSGSSCPTGFITNTSFWLGSAVNDYGLWYVGSNGGFGSSIYYNDDYRGVRPVIVLSKNDLEV